MSEVKNRGRILALSLLAATIACDLAALLLMAGRAPLWYDELLTWHASGLHPFSLLMNALWAGADGMPPAYYALVQLARLLPGDTAATIRYPSLVGYLLTLLGVYWFTRKRFTPAAAVTGVMLVMLSPFRQYAVEARSYSLLVGFLALAAALWQRADEFRFAKLLFAVCLAMAVACHHLAVCSIAVFGLAELVWSYQSRRLRWGVWAACLLATVPFLINLPTLMHFRSIFGANFWSKPKWSTVLTTYDFYSGLDINLALLLAVLYLGVLVSWLIPAVRGRLADADPRLSEAALVGGFLMYPAVLVVLTIVLGSGYTPRYGWPVILGLALGIVYLFRGFWPQSSSVMLPAALLLAFAVRSGVELRLLSTSGPVEIDAHWTKLIEISRKEPGIPVVIGSGVAYLKANEILPPDVRGRLVEVVDHNQAVRLSGTDTVDRANEILAQFVPLSVKPVGAFEAAQRRFILFSGGPSDWFTPYLTERHRRLTHLAESSGWRMYIVD